MFCWICVILFLAWVVFIHRFVRKIMFKELKYTLTRDPNLKEEYKPFERNDRKNWNYLEIYILSIFVMPLRAIGVVLSMCYILLIFRIFGNTSFEASDIELSKFSRFMIKANCFVISRIILFSSGFYYIPHTKCKIEDFEKDYPAKQYAEKYKSSPFRKNPPIV